MGMKAIHIITGLDPKDGGPSYSVPRLCGALRAAGCSASILTLGASAGVRNGHIKHFKHDWAHVPLARGLASSRGLEAACKDAAETADLVHVHGLWRMPNVYGGTAAARAKKPLVVSARGMLAAEALRFSTRRKQVFWHVMQRQAYAQTVVWHATSSDEAADIRRFGLEAPIAVIPNGIDLPKVMARHDDVRAERTVLFLSRIHPKKALPSLLTAWREVAPQRLRWTLLIVGPDEGGHRSALEAQARADGTPRVVFSGPVYGAEKEALLASIDVFVLPTKNENFGLVVAEALAAGVPAIVTKGAPWSGLGINDCGWWIDHGVKPLMMALLEATGLPAEQRRAMGQRGRTWMSRDFGWDHIGQQMLSVYYWIKTGGSPPACFFGN